MKARFKPAALAVLLALASLSQPGTHAADTSPLTAMFAWWNEAMRTSGVLDRAAFEAYFTEDAAIIINGEVRVQSLDFMPAHWQRIRENVDYISVELPFEREFREGNQIFTHHYIVARRKGAEETRTEVMGYALIRDGRISEVNFVRHVLP